ncbi:MAG: endonuclease [Bacteroidetes bacterium B1(2017)]|nr:MAG: endonuclease [Bacteroidetes bacterium B1(2017)]
MENSNEKHNLETGRLGEEMAAEYLVKNGYQILEKNYRFGRVEIDLICCKNKLYVFVEVKCRHTALVHPELAVDFSKQRNIARAASTYLHKYNIVDPIRFDIIAINIFQGKADIAHFEDAFYPVFYK